MRPGRPWKLRISRKTYLSYYVNHELTRKKALTYNVARRMVAGALPADRIEAFVLFCRCVVPIPVSK